MKDFPKSQHKPVLITTGKCILVLKLLPKTRWNFEKANWENSKSIDQTICRITPTSENNTRFNKLVLY